MPLCACVRACTRVCPEASVRSGGLPHRCLLNGQIHTTTTTTSLCPFSVLPQSCHPLFHFSLFFLFLSLSLFRPFFLSVVAVFFPPPPLSFGITPFSLPLSFPCQQRAHKRTGNYQGGEKVAANFPIYTFAQSPALRFALRPPAFISPIQTDPKQLHIYIGFILLGGMGRGGGGGGCWIV